MKGDVMVRYSRVSLGIQCELADVPEISAQLGVQPSEVAESMTGIGKPGGPIIEKVHHTWRLHSPMSADQADPTARLAALVEVIRPFADRLISLDVKWKRWIDILYHLTPQCPEGVAGEFDWIYLPAATLKLLADWGLGVGYETFWFNHPDWKRPRRSWWSRRLRRPSNAVL